MGAAPPSPIPPESRDNVVMCQLLTCGQINFLQKGVFQYASVLEYRQQCQYQMYLYLLMQVPVQVRPVPVCATLPPAPPTHPPTHPPTVLCARSKLEGVAAPPSHSHSHTHTHTHTHTVPQACTYQYQMYLHFCLSLIGTSTVPINFLMKLF